MPEFNLSDYIKSKRETLSPSSLKTYSSILSSLHRKIFKDKDIDPKDFDETDKILAFLKDVPANKRKSILAALVVITNDKKYRDVMLGDIQTYTHDIEKQEKSPEQEKSWVNSSDIKSVWEELKGNADLLYKKKDLKSGDLQQIQNFIIISLLGGIFIPPRRSLDYVCFKVKDVKQDEDNYLDKSTLVFNKYKTAKCYGQQKVAIPIQLKNILNKWTKASGNEYLLFDTNGSPLTSVKLNQRMVKIFDGKKAGVNIMRHSYLSEKFQDTIKKNQEMTDVASQMGTSKDMVVHNYIKKE